MPADNQCNPALEDLYCAGGSPPTSRNASDYNIHITKYANNRKFMELADVNLENSVNAEIIDSKLKNLKWINPNYVGTPNDEINDLKKTISFLKKDNRNKMLITHYQFIASLLPNHVSSPNRTYTDDSISYPKKMTNILKITKLFLLIR